MRKSTDVLLERFQKDVDRLPAGLLEPLRLLAQNLRREVFELQAETLFELFAFGFLGGALLGVLLFQAGDFRLGRGAQGGQFGFGAQPRFDLHADVRFGLQAGLSGGGLVGTQVAGFAAGGGEPWPRAPPRRAPSTMIARMNAVFILTKVEFSVEFFVSLTDKLFDSCNV